MIAIVTGATGFLGHYLVCELLDHHYQVFAIVKPNSDNIKRLPDHPNLYIVHLDLMNLSEMPQYIETADIFFHFGWISVYGAAQKDIDIQMKNIRICVDAVEVAKKLHCNSFIGAGSIWEKECLFQMQEEKPVRNLANSYKIAKVAAHYYAKLLCSEMEINFFWPQITNAYGIGETSPRLINSVIRQLLCNQEPALTKADQYCNFIYATDAVKAYRLIAERGTPFKDYVVGTSRICPLKEYLQEIQEVVNSQVPLGFGKHTQDGVHLPYSMWSADSTFEDTGFVPLISFQEGIQNTAKWIMDTQGSL